jgi:predicted dehydrogenase
MLHKPRVAFLGTGWIGRHRMEAMLATGAVEAVAIADHSPDMAAEAQKLAPAAKLVPDLDALLAERPDGVVIATPSALHATQAIQALDAGAAVFCQKPLGRDSAEAQAVVDAARRVDRLLAVDFSYRHTAGMQAIAPLVRDGALGRVFAADLVFHNADGPDKPWFYDRAQSGGGCVMDLGCHLIDLALWTLGATEAERVDAQLFAGGAPLAGDAVEDYAVAQLRIAGAAVRLACSWRVHAGVDAEIAATFYGTEGGASFRNVSGSFYDFEATRFRGTAREPLATPPDAWGGRAAAAWAERLARDPRYDPAAQEIVAVSRVTDAIYA